MTSEWRTYARQSSGGLLSVVRTQHVADQLVFFLYFFLFYLMFQVKNDVNSTSENKLWNDQIFILSKHLMMTIAYYVYQVFFLSKNLFIFIVYLFTQDIFIFFLLFIFSVNPILFLNIITVILYKCTPNMHVVTYNYYI